jgi:serine/threonine protein kinase
MVTEQTEFFADGRLGDYRVGQVMSEDARTITWKAEQISMGRSVILEALKPKCLGEDAVVDSFLADVRAKAAVDHPGIGSVYEAVQSDDSVYYAREDVAGVSLRSMVSERRTFPVLRILGILEQIGESIIYLEEKNLATTPLGADDIVLCREDVVRVVNPAIAGEPQGDTAWADRETVAALLRQLSRGGESGTTRMGRLLDYLTKQGEEEVPWSNIVHTAEKFRQQLEEGSRTTALAEQAQASRSRGFWWMAVTVGVLLAGVGGGLFVLARNGGSPKKPTRAPVMIPAGVYSGPGGGEVRIETIWIEAAEVTIADYSRFLEALQMVSESSRAVYDHPEQPSGRSGHEPEDWEALRGAAEENGIWQGLSVTLSCPVINVDWWDAYAYANWSGGRLPTQEEWFAARRGALPAWSSWGGVEDSTDDLVDGIYGLAGNVSEWTRDQELNPVFPLNPRRPLICGASYRRVQGGVEARYWVETRDLRRPDLGFRVVYEAPPE